LNATTSMGDTVSSKNNTGFVLDHRQEVVIEDYPHLVNNEEDYDCDDVIEDDLLLTKTEGSAMLRFGSNIQLS